MLTRALNKRGKSTARIGRCQSCFQQRELNWCQFLARSPVIAMYSGVQRRRLHSRVISVNIFAEAESAFFGLSLKCSQFEKGHMPTRPSRSGGLSCDISSSDGSATFLKLRKNERIDEELEYGGNPTEPSTDICCSRLQD